MLLYLVTLIVGLLSNTIVVSAESGGGQVSSTSKITFYQGDEQKKEEIIAPPKVLEKKDALPQTGEAQINRLVLGLGLLTLTSGVLLYKKKKQVEKV